MTDHIPDAVIERARPTSRTSRGSPASRLTTPGHVHASLRGRLTAIAGPTGAAAHHRVRVNRVSRSPSST